MSQIIESIYLENTHSTHNKFYEIFIVYKNNLFNIHTRHGTKGKDGIYTCTRFTYVEVDEARDKMQDMIAKKISSRGYEILDKLKESPVIKKQAVTGRLKRFASFM